MKYIVPKFDCVLFSNKSYEMCANVKYCVENVDNTKYFVFGKDKELPYFLDFSTKQQNANVSVVKVENDEYYFLFPQKVSSGNFVDFKFLNNHFCVSLMNGIYISCNGNVLVEELVYDISYSHFQVVGDLCIIYFTGKRNYVVIVKENEICCASFYDEYNVDGDEQYFLCRLHDSLNHGRVMHIKDKKFETYLVYLDDNELKLKSNFVGHVFLDCVMCENLKYCNELLVDSLKQKEVSNISNFFVFFDDIYAISKEVFVLFKKNTLTGIYKFEYFENKISNIIQLV